MHSLIYLWKVLGLSGKKQDFVKLLHWRALTSAFVAFALVYHMMQNNAHKSTKVLIYRKRHPKTLESSCLFFQNRNIE